MTFAELPVAKSLSLLVLLLACLLLARAIHKRDKCADSKLSLDDLLLGDDGKMSKAAAVMFGAFGLTTWMMVVLTLRDKMSEGYFGLYSAAWITPTVAALIVKAMKSTP